MSNETPIIAQYFGIFDDWYTRAMAKNPPFEKLNRLYIAFAGIKDGLIKYNEDGDKRKITDLVSACRKKNPTAEILVSSDPKETVEYLNAGNNPDKFAKSVLDFINENNLDGFDMDWEREINAGCMYKLLNALKIKFLAFQEKKLKLTLAVNPELSAEDYGLKRICLLVDQINLMSYGATRPLGPSARNFCYGGMSVYNIIGGIETETGYREFGGPDTLEDTDSIKQKCVYARTWDFAGMFEWRLDNDLAKDNKPTFRGALGLHDYTSLIPNTIEIFFTGGEERNILYGRVPGRGSATFLHNGCQGRPFASGEWVYFRGIDNNLYKCKSNGPSYDGWWARDCFSDPFVCGEYVYFQGNKNSLVRININTGIEKIVQESGCYSTPFVTITGAYYKGGENNSKSNNRLMCSKSDGSLVEIDCFCWITPFVSGDYVYFQGGDNSAFPHLYKKKISATSKEDATLVATNCGGSPFVSGDWVYYQGGTNREELYRINIKQGVGSEQLLDSHCGGQPFVTDCWVYFLGNTEKNQLYRRQVNGEASAEFVDSHCGASPFITGVLLAGLQPEPAKDVVFYYKRNE